MKIKSIVLGVLCICMTACQARVFNYLTSPVIRTLNEVHKELKQEGEKRYRHDVAFRSYLENKILKAHNYVQENKCGGTQPAVVVDDKNRCTDACWCVAEGFKCLARDVRDGDLPFTEIFYRINYVFGMYIALRTGVLDVALWEREIVEKWS